MKKLIEVLQSGVGYLADRGVENPRLIMEQLMSHVLKCPRLQLYLKFESEVPEERLAPLRAGIKRLGAGEPLQYVIGDTEFMGHRFRTDPRALIPRPDTEPLVQAVLDCEALWAAGPGIVDVGTGSGCVVVSLALAKPEARYVAVDRSEAALTLARENAADNGVGAAIEFRLNDLLAGFESGSFDAVVANLPYIPALDCQSLPRHIRDHEPMSALDGGADGLDLIRQLASQAARVLAPRGWIFLEIGFDQGPRVVDTLKEHGFVETNVAQDLGGRDRVVKGCRP